METVFCFHGALNDFLPASRRGQPVRLLCAPDQSFKHLIESLDVPHVEVAAVRVNGREVRLDALAGAGPVEVYPYATALGAPRPDGEPRFLLDNHLGRLAVYLRMLGLDTLYRNDYQDDELAAVAAVGERVLLTRDHRLLMRKAVQYGYWLRSQDPPEQLREVVVRYRLRSFFQPFTRCLRCNGPLRLVEAADVWERLQPLTQQYYDAFALCPACDQVYWRGSHYQHMQRLIHSLPDQPELDGGSGG